MHDLPTPLLFPKIVKNADKALYIYKAMPNVGIFDGRSRGGPKGFFWQIEF